MERVIDFRRPTSSAVEQTTSSSKLSKTSRIFFMLNIIQVCAVASIQTSMMLSGDFKGINEGGMGPGRRVYMALFCVAVVYTCFLCLFAVKSENFLEIAAFVLQNFGFIAYSFVQVYHISFKKYHGLSIKRDKKLAFLAISNCIVLIILNILFTILARQLFIEYGWKIYKRVRFNVKLRVAYHCYQLVVCLVKMTNLFVLMFTICLNQTILRRFPSSINYIASLCFVPFTLFVCLMALYGLRKENRILMIIFMMCLLTGQGLACYEIYSVGRKTCQFCQIFSEQTIDIPDEVILHVVYLASVALLMMFLLTLATLKAVMNFGMGLKDHFAGVSNHSNNLLFGLPGELMRSLFNTTIAEDFEDTPDVCQDDDDDVVIPNPTIVTSSPTNDKGTTDASTSVDSTRLHVKQSPEYMKSNSMPDRTSHQQRPSVLDRISKQASSRLHELYYRTVSVESSRNLCGCCFWKKRQSVNSFRVSFDINSRDFSEIFSEYCNNSSLNSSSMDEFYNPTFLPEDNFTVTVNKRGGVTKYQHTSEYRRGISHIRPDVIVEENEEIQIVASPTKSKDTEIKQLCNRQTSGRKNFENNGPHILPSFNVVERSKSMSGLEVNDVFDSIPRNKAISFLDKSVKKSDNFSRTRRRSKSLTSLDFLVF